MAADNFDGTEAYGDTLDNKKAWAIKFENIPFKKVKIESKEQFKNPYSKEYTKEEIAGKLGDDALLADPEKMKALGGAKIFISPLEKFRMSPASKYYLCEPCFEMDDFKDILNQNSLNTQVGIAEGPMRLLQKGDFI